MWIRRSPEEIVQARAYYQRARMREAGIVWLLSCLIVLVLRGGFEVAHGGGFLVPLDELANRLPRAILLSFAGAVLFFFYRSNRTVFICPKCDEVRSTTDSQDCPCGGHFEKLEEIKWIDDGHGG